MASTGEVWKLGHRPALDGVRGIAVLLVFAGHLRVPGVHDGGKSGVAVFFTLSGFLITALLLEEAGARGRVDLRRFYMRRGLRLLPAQVVCVLGVTAAALWFGTAAPAPGAPAAALLYVTNMLRAPVDGSLGHFWSLAVEEQFYLVWAPLFALLVGRISRGRLAVALLVLATYSSLARTLVVGTLIGGRHVSAWLPMQLDGLFVGCAVALLLHGRVERHFGVWRRVAPLLMLLPVVALPFGIATRFGMTLAALVTAVILWHVAQGDRQLSVLSSRALTLIGRRSYALYLWHYPVILTLRQELPGAAWYVMAAIALPISAALTGLSWRYVEAPFLRMKSRLSPAVNEVEAPATVAQVTV